MPKLFRKITFEPVLNGSVYWELKGNDCCIVHCIGVLFSKNTVIPETIQISANDKFLLLKDTISQKESYLHRDYNCLCEHDFLSIRITNKNNSTIQGFALIEF